MSVTINYCRRKSKDIEVKFYDDAGFENLLPDLIIRSFGNERTSGTESDTKDEEFGKKFYKEFGMIRESIQCMDFLFVDWSHKEQDNPLFHSAGFSE